MEGNQKILVVDDNPVNVRLLRDRLQSGGFTVIDAGDGKAALEMMKAESPDLVLLDILMPVMDGYAVLEHLKTDDSLRHIPVIVVTAIDQLDSAVRCIELGAVDYLTKPFNNVVLNARIHACLDKKRWHDKEREYQNQLEELNEKLEQRVEERTSELNDALHEVEQLKDRLVQENIYLQQEIKLDHNFEEIVSSSRSLASVLKSVEQVAVTDASVLILGETGTGKELLARAIHSSSERKDRPLVKVNCASLPANLIESELFGHEKGSFTGAAARRLGRFELADSGTIFLDEIAELPLELQPKLLRVLQEGEFERLGGTSTIKVDVRVIAATNRNLQKEAAEGNFREDLYYRLNVFPIVCPPLRERKEDIELLVNHFVAKYSAKIGKAIESVSSRAMTVLKGYDWPGNVRELENIIERSVIITQGKHLEIGDWFYEVTSAPETESNLMLEDVERRHISKVLDQTGWKIRGTKGAAEILGLKPTTLEARMKKLGIERPDSTT